MQNSKTYAFGVKYDLFHTYISKAGINTSAASETHE